MKSISYMLTRMKVNCKKMAEAQANGDVKSGRYRFRVIYFARQLAEEVENLNENRSLEASKICTLAIKSYKTNRGNFKEFQELHKLFYEQLAKFPREEPRRGRGRPSGIPQSVKTKKKISASKTGHKHTEETKRKISIALKKYCLENPDRSSSLSRWWDQHPEFKGVMAEFMKAYWAERRKEDDQKNKV